MNPGAGEHPLQHTSGEQPLKGASGEQQLKPVSKDAPLWHYFWGSQCDGWNLVDNPDLSVKLERMPPHTAEQEHFHQKARQFFFILKGKAVFETEEGRIGIKAQQGLEIRPQLRHRILNEGEEDLEFILCSQPSTAGDRHI
jgi:mannose-6-phosphate isomerase-like protein (cupin superfamily)